MKGAIIILAVLGCALADTSRFRSESTRIRVHEVEYDCSCRSYCPSFGITAGRCDDNDGWRTDSQNCCLPSYLDDRYDNDFRYYPLRPTFGQPRIYKMPRMSRLRPMYRMNDMFNSK